MILCKNFARYLFKAVKSAGGKVFGSKYGMSLHRSYQSRRSEFRELSARQRMLLQNFSPFAVESFKLFRFCFFRNFRAESGNGFQLFIAENSAYSSPACRALIAEYTGIKNFIFTGRADYKPAFVMYKFFLSFARRKSPKLFCILELNVMLGDMYRYRFFRSAGKDNCVKTGTFEHKAEIAAAV